MDNTSDAFQSGMQMCMQFISLFDHVMSKPPVTVPQVFVHPTMVQRQRWFEARIPLAIISLERCRGNMSLKQ